MAWKIFHQHLLRQENGNAIDLNSETDLRCMLVDATRTPVQATDANMGAIAANEVTGSNYTPEGPIITSTTVTESAGTITWDFPNIVFSQHASGFTDARHVILYKRVSSTDTDNLPIAYETFSADKGNVSGDLTLEMDTNGIFTKTVG